MAANDIQEKKASGATVDSLVPVDPDSMTGHDGIFAALALLPEKAILTEAAIAKAFGVTGRTIRRMVARHELPPPITISGRSVWFAGRVLSWIERAAERQEHDAERMIAKMDAFGA